MKMLTTPQMFFNPKKMLITFDWIQEILTACTFSFLQMTNVLSGFNGN